MKVIDLMIGDWIHNNYTNDNYQVWRTFFSQATNYGKRLDATLEDVNIAPIPITPEILEKNGFEKEKETEHSCSYCTLIPTGYEKNSYTCKFTFYKEPIMGVSTLFNCWGWVPPQNGGVNDIHICNLKYLHQLQHALKLCEIEKEIKL